MRDERGFTLTEVMVAIALSAIVAGAVFVVLDSGLRVHEKGTDMSVASQGLAEALALLRSDVARSDSVAFANVDSLVLLLPDGRRVAWAARPVPAGKAVYRSIDAGSGWRVRPLRPVAELVDAEFSLASLVFRSPSAGRVRAHFVTAGQGLSVEATAWRNP